MQDVFSSVAQQENDFHSGSRIRPSEDKRKLCPDIFSKDRS